jgi:hypothetical protein
MLLPELQTSTFLHDSSCILNSNTILADVVSLNE